MISKPVGFDMVPTMRKSGAGCFRLVETLLESDSVIRKPKNRPILSFFHDRMNRKNRAKRFYWIGAFLGNESFDESF